MAGLIRRGFACAGALVALASGALAQEVDKAPRLQFELTPYIWMAAIDVRAESQLRTGTTVSTNLSIPVADYLTKLNFAGMVAGTARYERFSLHTDFIYLNANSDNTEVRSVRTPLLQLPVTNTLNSSTRIQSTIWTLAGGYAVAEGEWGTVDVIGGVRLLALDQDVNFSLSRDITAPNGNVVLGRAGSMSASATIWNGVVGVRGRVRIADSDFYVPFQFDIGSGAAVWSWQAQVGIGYRTRWADLSAGYRYLSFQDSRNAVLQTLSMGGPILAATFRF